LELYVCCSIAWMPDSRIVKTRPLRRASMVSPSLIETKRAGHDFACAAVGDKSAQTHTSKI
jgi:hypothetical protein